MKRASHRLVIAAVLATTALTSLSAAAVTIVGMPSCGDWIETRKAPRYSVSSVRVESWLVGFLSGLAAGTGREALKGTDNASLFLWMDNYCSANPLKDVADGATDLYFELLKKNQK